MASDLEPRASGILTHDFLHGPPPPAAIGAPIVTNPPFNALDAFIRHGLGLLDAGAVTGLVLLLRSDALTAATVLGAAGIAALSGRIICGVVADRIGAKKALVACLLLQALAISLYLVARDLDTLYAVSVLFGFSYGGAMPLYAILVREYFPAKIMGGVFGVVAMISTGGMALGPAVGGWLFDHLGGYGWLYVASSAIGIAGALIAMTVHPHRPLPRAALSAAV